MFNPNGIYSFKLSNGSYAAFVVLDAVLNEEIFMVLLTDFNDQKPPTLIDIQRSEVLPPPDDSDSRIRHHAELIKPMAIDALEMNEIGLITLPKQLLRYGYIVPPFNFLIEWAERYLVDQEDRPETHIWISDNV